MLNFSLDAASETYKTKREDLRLAEIALIEQRERVAQMRRSLSTDTPLAEDYELTESTGDGIRTVRISELFEPSPSTLIVCHFMWAEKDKAPCPMCTMWTDGYDAILPHVSRNTSFVIVAKQQPELVRTFAGMRKWKNLRFLSSANTSFNKDFGMETDSGTQLPGLSVFVKSADNSVRHYYTVSAIMDDDHYRGMDLLTPVWNMLDLLPRGRGDWFPSLDYEAN